MNDRYIPVHGSSLSLGGGEEPVPSPTAVELEVGIVPCATLGLFRRPGVNGSKKHDRCGRTWDEHLWLDPYLSEVDLPADGIAICPTLPPRWRR